MKAWPGDQGQGLSSPTQQSLDHCLDTVSSFETPSAWGTSKTWSELSIGTPQPSGLENLSSKEKLRDKGSFSLEKRWGLEGYHEDGVRLFTVEHGGRMNGNRIKLKQERCRLACSPQRQSSSGIYDSERLYRLSPWRFPRPYWTKP